MKIRAFKKRTAVYAGTFDPITCGHIDIVKRACHVFDEIVVAVATDTPKATLFSLAERVELAEDSLKGIDGATVQGFSGLLVHWMQANHWRIIVRGLRLGDNQHHEWGMATLNQHLDGDLETIFFHAHSKYIALSSRVVRELSRLGGDVSTMVPVCVENALRIKQENNHGERGR